MSAPCPAILVAPVGLSHFVVLEATTSEVLAGPFNQEPLAIGIATSLATDGAAWNRPELPSLNAYGILGRALLRLTVTG